MTKRELIETYNNLAILIDWNPIKQFRDVATGERRLALAREENNKRINQKMEAAKAAKIEKEKRDREEIETQCKYCGVKIKAPRCLNITVCSMCQDSIMVFLKAKKDIQNILNQGKIAKVYCEWENHVPKIMNNFAISNFNSLRNMERLWQIEMQSKNIPLKFHISQISDELPPIYRSDKHEVWQAWNNGKGITNPRKLKRKTKSGKLSTIKRWISLWKKGKSLPAITRMGIKSIPEEKL